MKFCPKCGTSLADNDRFCPKCGAEFASYECGKTGAVLDVGAKSQIAPKPKKTSPILGIVSLVLALAGFFGDPPIFTVIISIVAFILAIVALKKKCKLKGFAIAAIIFAVYSLLVTAFLGRDTSSKQKLAETAVESDTAHSENEGTTETSKATEITYADYSICGITFKIPDTYSFSAEEDSYISADENKLIHFEDGGEGITDDQLKLSADQLDEKTDEVAEGFLSNYVRKSGLESEIAGCLARSYCYTGEYDGKDAVLYVDYINNTKNNTSVIAIGVAVDPDKESFEDDYQGVINSAEYTNATSTVMESTGQETQAEGTEGVDPDLVAFLTEYEKFVDSYCEFMRKYAENPADLSMLTEYAKMMEQSLEFADKVDDYDSNEMSTADAAYYIEVTARCSQKMLQVAGSMSGN